VEARQLLPAVKGEGGWRPSLPVQRLSAVGQHSTARRRVPSAQRLVRRRSVRAQGGQRGRPRSRSQFVSTSEDLSKLARKPTDRWGTWPASSASRPWIAAGSGGGATVKPCRRRRRHTVPLGPAIVATLAHSMGSPQVHEW